MSEFREHVVTAETIPTARLLREFFRDVADTLNRIGPGNLSNASPILLSSRVRQYNFVALAITGIVAANPLPYSPFYVHYTRSLGVGRLVLLDVRQRLPANFYGVAGVARWDFQAQKNGIDVGAQIQLTNGFSGEQVDLSLDANAPLVATDEIRLRVTTAGPAGAGTVYWSTMLGFTEELVTF